MFHRYGKGKTSHSKALKDLTAIIPASLMLAEEKRQPLLEQIKEHCELEDARFDSLCLSLIHNLINHCQRLPETSTSYYSQSGGLLDHALNRTEAALDLFKKYMLLDEQGEISEEQKLWQYALFSAAILQGIGKLQIDYTLALYDNNGQLLKQWCPLLESLGEIGSHYSYEFQKGSDDEFRRRLNLLMARLLMPASGFSWIASNPQVLAVWLALLNEDAHAAGTLGAILIRANALSIQRYFNHMLLKNYGLRGGRYGRVGTFVGGVPESLTIIEQQIGVEFVQWLMKFIDAGRIMINKAPLLMVPGGMLMCADIFKYFVREHPEYKNWQAVQNGFLSLGLHKLASDGGINSRFEHSATQQMYSGVIFANYAVALPATFQVHQQNNGRAASTAATAFIYESLQGSQFIKQQKIVASASSLPLLNTSGHWQQGSGAAQIALKNGLTNGV